jgi:hypothetical protein
MQIFITKRETRLTKAINKFYVYKGTVLVLKIAYKHKVNYSTLTNRINSKHGFIASNSSLNKLLAVAWLSALFLYIQKQALARFLCTWAIILVVVL